MRQRRLCVLLELLLNLALDPARAPVSAIEARPQPLPVAGAMSAVALQAKHAEGCAASPLAVAPGQVAVNDRHQVCAAAAAAQCAQSLSMQPPRCRCTSLLRATHPMLRAQREHLEPVHSPAGFHRMPPCSRRQKPLACLRLHPAGANDGIACAGVASSRVSHRALRDPGKLQRPGAPHPARV